MTVQRPLVTTYTDGGAEPNPGPGGWAVILLDEETGVTRELSGGQPDTTNNRMELVAAIKALEALQRPSAVHFYTDSEYLRLGITEWLDQWAASGWRRRGGELQNVDLWQRLDALTRLHEIRWEWVKGHAGNRYNTRADQLATQARQAAVGLVQALEPTDVSVYLRVSCHAGRGGWAALLRDPEGERVLSGHLAGTTSNQLDLMAAITALGSLPDGARPEIWTASDYLRHGATQWLAQWRGRNWETKDRTPVKNKALWMQLDELLASRPTVWRTTKEYAVPEFDRLDKIALAEAAKARS